uniref:Uncharacterized protein n=1 Tax=Panagrellus redivivus TaxID=6233 RepID=A0A7E4VR43_PANRE
MSSRDFISRAAPKGVDNHTSASEDEGKCRACALLGGSDVVVVEVSVFVVKKRLQGALFRPPLPWSTIT